MNTPRRYLYIDALRGVAALAVVYFHSAMMILDRRIPLFVGEWSILYGLTNILDLGKIAVIVFFAISGYVVPFTLIKPESGTKVGFVIGRIFRLYPAYWVSMLGAFVFLYAMTGETVAGGTIIANVTMMQKFVGFPDMIGVYWTLQIEILFYIICFGMSLVGWLDRPRIVFAAIMLSIVLALAMAVMRSLTSLAVPVALPLSLAIMFFGMLWRIRDRPHSPKITNYIREVLIALAVIVPPIAVLAYSADPLHSEVWYRYVLTYYAAVPLFCIFTSMITSSSRILTYLGTISYSVYLFGAIVEAAVDLALPGLLNGQYPAHLFIAIVMIGTVAVSALVFALVERPSIRLGKWLARKATHRALPASRTAFEAPL